jgi:hypothetical protein
MVDWKWLVGILLTFALMPLIRGIYKLFVRVSAIEGAPKLDVTIVVERLAKLETDNVFVLKIIWEFLIAKVHSENDEFAIDELLDKWKAGELKSADEIELLMVGLDRVAREESDNTKKAAAESLLRMINRGIGITVRV